MTLESESRIGPEPDENPRVLVIACGALARELVDVIKGNGLAWVDVECLPAKLHNTPDQITAASSASSTQPAGRTPRKYLSVTRTVGTGGPSTRC